MVQKTKIEWADYSSNPLKFRLPGHDNPVNLCIPKSPGCAHCYASAITKRFAGVTYAKGPMREATPILVEKELKHMLTFRPKPPFAHGDIPTVFPFDMTDLFGEWVPFELIDRVFAVFALRSDVRWLVLTKWPERAAEYLGDCRPDQFYTDEKVQMRADEIDAGKHIWRGWPLTNVAIGTSCERQQEADERVPWLVKCPAAIRFVSAEPLLGPIDFHLDGWTEAELDQREDDGEDLHGECTLRPELDWIITGGESGPGARPCDYEWVRDIKRQCQAASVPCFVKQLGSNAVSGYDPVKRGYAMSLRFEDKKGGNPAEWPADLRVRQFPTTTEATSGEETEE